MKAAHRDSANPYFKSTYADLASVYDACRDALHENGIALLQPASSPAGEVYGVETVLLHESAQWISDTLFLKPTKNDPQAAGSAITYARRYSLAAMVGVMQVDDDANAASGHKPNQAPATAQPIPAAGAKTLSQKIKEFEAYDPANDRHKVKLKDAAIKNERVAALQGEDLKKVLIDISNTLKGVNMANLEATVKEYLDIPFGL